MDSSEKIAQKKQKSKHDKRKHEEAEAEPEVVLESKKDKKKKKKQRQEEIFSYGLAPNNEKTETFNGSIEEYEKKKKKQSQEDSVNNGLLPDFDAKTETVNGSVEESKKKKKKKKSKQEEEGGKESLSNGAAEKCDDQKEIVDGFVEKSKESKRIGGGEHVEVSESNGSVVMSGKDVNDTKYKPLKSFGDSGLPDNVIECCKNFDKPSPIQSHSWPFLLDGRDFIGIAATGSGKTLAFGVPAIVHVLNKRKSKTSKRANPLCLVLSPTRELAQQIADVLCDAGKPSGVKSVCLYGGTSKGPQISSLKSGVDIVIGTPGRLRDLMEMGVCNLNEVSYVDHGTFDESEVFTDFELCQEVKWDWYDDTAPSVIIGFLVLDEADRMLDMGFEPEVRAILSQTCSARQMLMFSATWPLPVHQLAQEFMDPHPIKVVVGSEDLAANHDVMQIVEVLDDRARDERLANLLEKYHKSRRNRVLVFVLYKKEASRVENMLSKRGWKVVSISGDKAQNARNQALSVFKEGSCPLLIATDVAARGLDIPDVEVVINYSFPLTTEDYVHRIGRTGRAGKKGIAHTFFTKENKGLAGELINVLKEAGQVVPATLLNFGTHVKKKESKLYGAHFREIDANAPKATKTKFCNSDDES